MLLFIPIVQCSYIAPIMLNVIPQMKDLCLGILNLAVNIRLFYQSS